MSSSELHTYVLWVQSHVKAAKTLIISEKLTLGMNKVRNSRIILSRRYKPILTL